jgi:hypothetical protein
MSTAALTPPNPRKVLRLNRLSQLPLMLKSSTSV